MAMIGFPLLLIPLAICNIIVFLMPGLSFAAPLVTLTLPSGTVWAVTLSDMLLALGMVLLLFEVIKGARPGAKYLTDHLLSLLVFGGAAAEFVLLPQFGTPTFFLLTLIALVDFLSGVALRTRRSVRATAAPVTARPLREETIVQTRIEPAVPAMPAAASVAEAVLLDAPAPKPVAPEVIAVEPSPQIPSPGIQPGSGSNPAPDIPPR
jgi:hypothetical protein